MAVTAALIKELRERTGVGMSACKNALVETDGNMDAAIEFLESRVLQMLLRRLVELLQKV